VEHIRHGGRGHLGRRGATVCMGNIADTEGSTVVIFSTPLDVTSHGAVGDGETVCTDAFQRAVDACHSAGGGTVSVPPGTYVLGRVHLRSSVTLELAPGAVIRPSQDVADYPPVAGAEGSRYRPDCGDGSLNRRYAVLYACGEQNVCIRGQGKLQGDGPAFWDVKNTGEFERWNCVAPWFYYTPRAFRPLMVMLEDSRDCQVRDITIEDTASYAGWFAGCCRLRFTGITVLQNQAGPNTDGFHFSSCRGVHITDCHFTCGDDCIAIDPNNGGPARGFVVTGCTFDTTVNVFRIYTGLDTGLAEETERGVVSDIVASNCAVQNASGVFNVTADGGDIRRLAFSNFAVNMDLRGSAFFVVTLNGGTIDNVALSNMTIRTDGLGTISGEGGALRGISLQGIIYEACPRTKLYGNGLPEALPSYALAHFAPYNLNIRQAEDVRLSGLRVTWGEADLADLAKVPDSRPYWPCIECRQVRGLVVQDVVCGPYGAEAAAVGLTDVADALLTGCRAEEGTGVFLRISGQSRAIALSGNDLAGASTACELVDPGTGETGSLSPGDTQTWRAVE